jgi:hypothetical protein
MQQQNEFLLFTREEFKDWILETVFTRKIKVIQQHNTADPDYSDFKNNNHFKLLQSMKNAHLARKFSTIAQNITIFPDSIIAICRDFNQDPAGIYGWNDNAICIENLGWFDVGKDKMTDEQKESIIFVTAMLCLKFKLIPNIDTVIYHRWFSAEGKRINNGVPLYKTCPGSNFFGGSTIESAQKNFIPLVIAKMNEIVKGDDKKVDENVPIWKTQSVEWMKSVGIITSDHDPLEQLDFGSLAAILKNFVNVYKLKK